MDASINVEVFSGASDRFGGKIAAVMYRPLAAESVPLVRRACADCDAPGAARPDILPGRRRATGPSMHAAGGGPLPERRRKIVRGIRTRGLDGRPGWSAGGAWRMAPDWASGAA